MGLRWRLRGSTVGVGVVSGTKGINCVARCPGHSVTLGIWIMFGFSIFFFLPCFSETVESKCSGIWAAVNGNEYMVYFFLNSWKLYYHKAGYKITPPLFQIVKWVLKDDGNIFSRSQNLGGNLVGLSVAISMTFHNFSVGVEHHSVLQ